MSRTALLTCLVAMLMPVSAIADDVDLTLPATGGTDAFHVRDGGGVSRMSVTEDGDVSVGGELDLANGRVIRQISVQTDSTTRNFTTGWALGNTFATVGGFKAGSLVRLHFSLPMRNDSLSWGGGYTEPQVSFDGGTSWNSLGSGGYDGPMVFDGRPIIRYANTLLIDPAQGSDFSVTVRFYHKSYDGTLTVNGSHDINAISGTAPLMSGVNGLQHYTRLIVEELH
ncbi:MAG: hypothetical protein ACQGVC_26420 [Myxococcota bacterium]